MICIEKYFNIFYTLFYANKNAPSEKILSELVIRLAIIQAFLYGQVWKSGFDICDFESHILTFIYCCLIFSIKVKLHKQISKILKIS